MALAERGKSSFPGLLTLNSDAFATILSCSRAALIPAHGQSVSPSYEAIRPNA